MKRISIEIIWNTRSKLQKAFLTFMKKRVGINLSSCGESGIWESGRVNNFTLKFDEYLRVINLKIEHEVGVKGRNYGL